jgi:hypothetical protein
VLYVSYTRVLYVVDRLCEVALYVMAVASYLLYMCAICELCTCAICEQIA